MIGIARISPKRPIAPGIDNRFTDGPFGHSQPEPWLQLRHTYKMGGTLNSVQLVYNFNNSGLWVNITIVIRCVNQRITWGRTTLYALYSDIIFKTIPIMCLLMDVVNAKKASFYVERL